MYSGVRDSCANGAMATAASTARGCPDTSSTVRSDCTISGPFIQTPIPERSVVRRFLCRLLPARGSGAECADRRGGTAYYRPIVPPPSVGRAPISGWGGGIDADDAGDGQGRLGAGGRDRPAHPAGVERGRQHLDGALAALRIGDPDEDAGLGL